VKIDNASRLTRGILNNQFNIHLQAVASATAKKLKSLM